MHKKAIIHLMTKNRMKSEAFTAEIDAIEDISEKYWVKNIIFYKWEKIEYADLITKLEKFWIFVQNYYNKSDLKEKISDFISEYEVVFVSTPMELLVNTVNEINNMLWLTISDDPEIFRNKYLQRELIQNHNPELWIKFIKWTVDSLDIKKIEEKIKYPFIIKPVDWVQSSWVAKITNRAEYNNYISTYNDFHDRLKSRWVDNKYLIVEDFINWKIYSIDYFISSEWVTTISKPVKVKLWIDVKVEDYSNIARVSTEKTENDFKGKRLKTFINSTVKACGIRNTFVHHEFKINSKWDLKTIELNWRVWWWRVDLMRRTYGINLYEMICNSDLKIGKIKENNIVVNIYATKRWILKAFNNKILANIKRRESVYGIELEETFLWKEVWLTKDWFIKVWAIKLAHKDYSEISKDFKYIKTKYLELLKIEETNPKKEKKVTILCSIKSIFKKRRKAV